MITSKCIYKQGHQETYKDVEKLLFSITHRFARMYGMDFNDVFSAGQELFMKAIRTYKPDKGTYFSSWFNFILTRCLITILNKEQRYRGYNELNEEIAEHPKANLDLLFDFDDLTADACEIIELVLNPNDEFSLWLKWEGVRSPSKVLKLVTEYLMSKGWEEDRCKETIEEVKEYLGIPTKKVEENPILKRIGLSREQVSKGVLKNPKPEPELALLGLTKEKVRKQLQTPHFTNANEAI